MHGSRPLVIRFNSSFFLLALVAMLVMSPVAFGQATTGALAGSVSAAEDGAFLPGVTIEAIHVPTGTVYTSVTGGNGRFMIPNVRVGGPYKVTATLEGFQPSETGGVNVNLGATAEVPVFKIRMGAFEESIVVTADADPLINPNKSGSTSAVSTEQIETLPTVNRTLQDFARTNPYVNVDAQDISATRMYVAGKNNRYNSIQIDGAVNNDLFGLADTGTPGGQANAQAISLEAIQEIQVAISPYDVRQGGFTGGGVNAITRSGGNDLQGSVFYSKRDPEWVGDGPNNNPISAFDSEQYGGRVGGRIIRDKLFFFVNGEYNDKNEDDDYTAQNYRSCVGRPLPCTPGSVDVQTVYDFLLDEFGYDAGGLGSIARASESKNFFGRFDWNVNSSNQFTIRHNYVNASNDVISDRRSDRFRFPKSTYFFEDETNSTVMQLNSVFSSNAFNEARVSYTTIKDRRASAEPFPGIEIGGTGPRNADIIAGSEQFSTANSLDQDILEITDDFTLLRGSHNITIGTHNEIFEFNNVFMPSAFGHYYFPSLQDFLNLNPSQYFYTYAEGGINPSKFKVNQLGLYASDQWAVRPNLTLTFGLRADAALYPDSPNYNPIVDQAIGYDTSATPDEDPTFSPRLGANWQISDIQQLRGGIGVFAGRTPYVWISNAYGGTGIGQISISCIKPSCTPTFVADPFNQPTNFPAGGGAFAASLTDPDFKSPRLWRATAGYDRLLPWDIRATVEILYSKTIEDVYYQNVNYIESGAVSPLDGRPMYKRASTALSNAFLLTNTSKGDQLMESIVLTKTIGQLTIGATYAHQEANSAFDGTSSTASSNWQFHHTKGNIYKPELSRSAFETEHRYNINGTFNFATGFITHAIGVYYNAQSGRPYSLMIGTDVNGDGASSNDLLYIPGSAEEIIVEKSNGDRTAGYSLLGNYLSSAGLDPLAGRAMDRYEATEPWVRQMDLHYELGLPAYSGVRSMITADVTNVLAMVDSDYGEVRYVANQNFNPVTYRGLDAATGKPVYRERFADALKPGSQFTTATDRSRWQARLGVRVSF